MQLNLDQSEATLLRTTLDNHLGDLRMEIGKTEDFEMRKALQANEALLKGIISRLTAETPSR